MPIASRGQGQGMNSGSHGPGNGRGVRWLDARIAVVLLAVTVVAYFPALQGEFLLDDDEHVTKPELQTLDGLRRIWTEIGATQQYYPVLHTAFWLEHKLWGDSVFGYHVINVILHVVAAYLIVGIMRRLSLPGAWLAGFIFALHPVNVESVAWISEQKNTLSTVFYLAAAMGYLRFTENGERKYYAIASVLFGMALLAKTATATLPAALAVVLWWRRGRLEWQRDFLPLLSWLLAAMVAGFVTLRVEQQLIAAIEADVAMARSERIVVAARALWFYFAQLFWPANLTFFHERWAFPAGAVWPYGFVVATLAVLATTLWLRRRWRGPLAVCLVFGGTLLPILGFVDVEWFVFSFVADHFLYLASLAIIMPCAAMAARMVGPRLVRLAIPGVVGALAMITWGHGAAFRDNVSLYTEAVARSPNSVVAHHHLGVALLKHPARLHAAVAEFEAALRLNPKAAEAHENLGVALLQLPERSADAISHLEVALLLKPRLSAARQRLAGAYFDQGKTLAADHELAAAAIAAYERALHFDPRFAEAHYNLGNLLLKDPAQLNDAVAHFEAAVRIKPDFAEAHANLGTVLVRMPGRLREAIEHFEAALRANPDFSIARNNLARARQLYEDTLRDD